MKRTLAMLLLPALWSCGGGGGSPTRPTAATPSPTPVPLELRDALSGEPVAGEVSERPGGIAVLAADYLPRESSRRGLVALWPTAPRPGYWMPESYVRNGLYDWEFQDGTPGRLVRWTRPIVMGPSADLEGDSEVMDILRRLEQTLLALPLGISVSVSALESEANVVFTMEAPDSANALAEAHWRVGSDWGMRSARIRFRDRGILLGGPPRYNTPLHEMGHVLGLVGHSERVTDVMHTGSARTRDWVFSGDETALLTMMYAFRRPGNAAPDRDLELSPARAGGGEAIVACGG